MTFSLFLTNTFEFCLGSGLGNEIIDARFGCDGCCGEWVVTGDHDGANTHSSQFGKAFADAAFYHIFENDNAEYFTVFGYGEWRGTGLSNFISNRRSVLRKFAPFAFDEFTNRLD